MRGFFPLWNNRTFRGRYNYYHLHLLTQRRLETVDLCKMLRRYPSLERSGMKKMRQRRPMRQQGGGGQNLYVVQCRRPYGRHIHTSTKSKFSVRNEALGTPFA